MKKTINKIPTDNNLLIRIDERQKQMSKDVSDINKKVDSLWDSKNKLVGWMLGAGIAGGGISTVLASLVKTIWAYF